MDEQRTQSNEPKLSHPQERIEDLEPDAVRAVEDLDVDPEEAETVAGGTYVRKAGGDPLDY